jgi:hypothetical protein
MSNSNVVLLQKPALADPRQDVLKESAKQLLEKLKRTPKSQN